MDKIWTRKKGTCDICNKAGVPVVFIAVRQYFQVSMCRQCTSEAIKKLDEMEVDRKQKSKGETLEVLKYRVDAKDVCPSTKIITDGGD